MIDSRVVDINKLLVDSGKNIACEVARLLNRPNVKYDYNLQDAKRMTLKYTIDIDEFLKSAGVIFTTDREREVGKDIAQKLSNSFERDGITQMSRLIFVPCVDDLSVGWNIYCMCK